MSSSTRTVLESSRISSIGLDCALYGVSAVVALVIAASSTFVTHQLWALPATASYLAAAVTSGFLARASTGWRESTVLRIRVGVATGVLVGSVLFPLALAVILRAERGPAFTHDEVITTERAGASLLQAASPYDHSSTPADAQPRRFPYLPLMALVGLPRAVWPTAALADARVCFFVLATLVGAWALHAWPAWSPTKLRALQVVVLLPIGALSVVAGGNDLLVLMVMLLGLVFHREGLAGRCAVVVSCAGLLKATSWPLWLVLAATELRRGSSLRVVGGYSMLPAGVTAMLVWDSDGLVADTMLFPLGFVDRVAVREPLALQELSWQAGLMGATGLIGVGFLICGAIVTVAWMTKTTTWPGSMKLSPTSLVAMAAALLTGCALLAVGPARPGLWAYALDLAAWSILFNVGWNGPVRPRNRGPGDQEV